jgi:hypothetical protein
MSPSGKSRSIEKQEFPTRAVMNHQFRPTKRHPSINLAVGEIQLGLNEQQGKHELSNRFSLDLLSNAAGSISSPEKRGLPGILTFRGMPFDDI